VTETGPKSIEHKTSAWDAYQARGGKWKYDRWSKTYDVNMTQASKTNKAMDAYRDDIGWGQREVTVDVKIDGKQLNAGWTSLTRQTWPELNIRPVINHSMNRISTNCFATRN